MIRRKKQHQENQFSRRRGAKSPGGYVGVIPAENGFMARCGNALKGPFKSDIEAAIAVQESEGNYYEAGRLTRLSSLISSRSPGRLRDLPRHVYRCRGAFRAAIRRKEATIHLGVFNTIDAASAAAEAFIRSSAPRDVCNFDPKERKPGARYECCLCSAEFDAAPEQCPKCGSLKIEPLA